MGDDEKRTFIHTLPWPNHPRIKLDDDQRTAGLVRVELKSAPFVRQVWQCQLPETVRRQGLSSGNLEAEGGR
jgi:hypothetical protein